MNINKSDERAQLVIDLFVHGTSIYRNLVSMRNIGDADTMGELEQTLDDLCHLLDIECEFGVAIFVEMENMKTSDEDSKWTFPVEKAFYSFIKEHLFVKINRLLDSAQSIHFEDYQARNFQNELCQKIEMLRDYYKEQYELEDDDE